MNVMGCRVINLQAAYEGLIQTGYSFIGYKDGILAPLLTGDDLGIYILIPRLALFLGCSIDRATQVFFYGLLYIPFCIATLLFLVYFESWAERIVGIIGLALIMRVAYGLGDVYLTFYAAAMIQIPFSLWFFKKERSCYGITGFMGGIFSGVLHIVRSYSFVAGIIFFSTLLISSKIPLKRTLCLFINFLLGFSLCIFVINMTYNSSMKFAKASLNADTIENAHVFWHQVYIGLGLLEWGNKNEISYSDAVAAQKAQAINPMVRYCSTEYEHILKNETIDLIINEWKFFLITLFAKLGILFYFFIKFCNIGILCAFIFQKKFWVDFAFFCTLSFNALPCLIALPLPEYALGFVACSALYGIISVNYAVECIRKNSFLLIKNITYNFFPIKFKQIN